MKIERAEKWMDEVDALLAPALAHDPLYNVGELAGAVNRGETGLYIVREGDEITGAFAMRFEDYSTGSELIVQAAGSQSAVPYSRAVVPFIRELASRSNVDFIRAHVPDPRWQRVLERYGFVPVETMMRMGVT